MDNTTANSSPPFHVVPYRPDGGSGQRGLLLTWGITILSGLALGAAVGFISRWLYVAGLFPLAIGGIAGLLGMLSLTTAKVRAPLLAGTIGFVSGCLAIGVVHTFQYQRFLHRLSEQPQLLAQWEADGDGFLQFIDLQAQRGVEIIEHADTMKLGYYQSYIYWLVDLLLAAGFAAYLMWNQARAPFCTVCQDWKETYLLAKLRLARGRAKYAVTTGQLALLRDQVAPPAGNKLLLKVSACSRCGPDCTIVVLLQEVSEDGWGGFAGKRVCQAIYPSQAMDVLNQLTAEKPEPIQG
ncbi:MAG TPA: hypothetical protein VFA18_08075 [Gemmataceae bacterium]|nr:hypothetical protein [Gemmataceae bacterium]